MTRTPEREDNGKTDPIENKGSAIGKSPNVLVTVIFPILLLAALLFVVMSIDMGRVVSPCENYLVIKLIYPFLFGALGVVLGGRITLNGRIPIFGYDWDGRVTGGIAAAVLGFVIALWDQPKTCDPKHELVLQNFLMQKQIERTEGGQKVFRQYISRFDSSDRDIEIVVDKAGDNSRDLKFLFSGKDRFSIHFDFFRRTGAGQYEPVSSCNIEVKTGSPPHSHDVRQFQLVASQPDRFELEFNPKYFDLLEDALKQGSVDNAGPLCLRGNSRSTEQPNPEQETIVGPIYVSSPSAVWPISIFKSSELWFVVTQVNEQPHVSARTNETSDGEVVTGPPVAAPTPASTDVKPDAFRPPTQSLTGCATAPLEPIRAEVDKYISGDDLDRSRRTAIYSSSGTSLHCYVWSLVSNVDNKTPAVERARALRLVVNAIINNSTKSDPLYWQPGGANRREFNQDLPYLLAKDYKTVFDLSQTDDVLVRGEAVRFIRDLPVDRFAALFVESGTKLPELPPAQRERLGIASAFMYYNRIVEWLDGDTIDSTEAINSVRSDFDAARRWTTDAVLGKAAKSYEAMLWYARAIVERERMLTPDKGKNSFATMITELTGAPEPYPSNYRHIAQALGVSQGGEKSQEILTQIETAHSYTPTTLLGDEPNLREASAALYAGPGDQYRLLAKSVTDRSTARLLLHKGDWYLASGKDWIGWFRRSVKAS